MYRSNGSVSKLVALLPEAAGAPTLHELERNLARGGLPVRFEQGQAGTCLVLFEEADSTLAVDVKVRPTGIRAQHVQLARLSGSELDAAGQPLLRVCDLHARR